ncbi:MAG: hypothetical protein M3355_07280 [Actinomycetota bacterium]|nr:hypothetical protein [Actinomycetota bacterium]
MKKIAMFAVVGAVALAPAVASAGGRSYDGAFDTGGELHFKVVKSQDGKKVINYRFERFAVNCEGRSNTTTGDLSFSVRVQNNKFDTRAILGDPGNPKATLNLHGKLLPNGAEGTMKIEGRKVRTDTGPNTACSSPKTGWTAS